MMTTQNPGIGAGNLSRTRAIEIPLEILVISEQRQYRDIGAEYYRRVTTPQGSTLYNVRAITTSDLNSPTTPRSSDILLFDLRGDLNQGLSALEQYLSKHQDTFVVASIEEDSLDSLLEHPRWQDLQRNANGLALTQNYRFGSGPSRKLGDNDYQNHFGRVHKELLTDVSLAILDNLRNDTLQVTKTIIPHSTEFAEFSRGIRREYPSGLVIGSLDTIARFNPDGVREELEMVQPVNRLPIPQHVYPPFASMHDLSPQEVREFLQGKTLEPASLYFHIPFCPVECMYCDFSTLKGGGSREAQERYLDLLRMELVGHPGTMDFSRLGGIHIGGGTPSMLAPDMIRRLGKIIEEFVPGYKDRAQISFEVNPGGLSAEKLGAFREIGATRASAGIQTTNEPLLSFLKRFMAGDKGQRAVDMLLERWPGNTNIDLIYGLPGQTPATWERDLNFAIEIGVPSVTVYELRVSDRSRFPGNQRFPTLYETMLMHVMAIQRFLDANFTQKIDNQFVKSDETQPYNYRDLKKRGGTALGLGSSAYSIIPVPSDQGIIYFKIGAKDPHDPRNLEMYKAAVEAGVFPVEMGRFLSPADQMSLLMIQGLKLSGVNKQSGNGVNLDYFQKTHGQTPYNAFPHLPLLMRMGLLQEQNGHLGLTLAGHGFETMVLRTFYQR